MLNFLLPPRWRDSSDSVVEFLQRLAEQAQPQAKVEWHELVEFACKDGAPKSLQAWDVSYYSEKLRQSRYQVSQEDIRPYLPPKTRTVRSVLK